MTKYIELKGVRTNNLKNLTVKLPINEITCLTGPSGSGKTSLAFHTLYQESKRRFINSFPTGIKFFWDIPQTVDVDSIYPVLPVWALPQHNPVVGSRPSVCDFLNLTDKFTKFFFLMARPTCLKHGIPFKKKEVLPQFPNDVRVVHFFIRPDEFQEKLSGQITPTRSYDGKEIHSFDSSDPCWELFRMKASDIEKIPKKIEENNCSGINLLMVSKEGKRLGNYRYSVEKICPKCSTPAPNFTVDDFNPYNALGACPECRGYGTKLKYDREKLVKDKNLSINDGAINFLEYKRFSYLKPSLINLLKKKRISVHRPFKEVESEKLWKLLHEGEGRYPGFDDLFLYLESKKYKRSVRIFLRSVQSEYLCKSCQGTRLKRDVLSSLLTDNITLADVLTSELVAFNEFITGFNKNFIEQLKELKLQKQINEIKQILKTSLDLGLGHIRLNRKVKGLTTGEHQRVLLTKYLSFQGSGSLFIFDEPSLGLDQNEQKKLVSKIKKIKDQGNTVILVDHSPLIQKNSDHIIVMGPGAGMHGGEITYSGSYIPTKTIRLKKREVPTPKGTLKIKKASAYGLSEKSFEIKLGCLNIVTGPSGSGKTTYFLKCIADKLHSMLFGEHLFEDHGEAKLRLPKGIVGVKFIDSSFKRVSSRSTIGTYIDLAPQVRKYFASLEVSKKLGLVAGHFSPNSELGQCPACEGKGTKTIEMHFLEDLQFSCEECHGMRLNRFYGTISDGEMSVYDAYNMPLYELVSKIPLTAKYKRIFKFLETLSLSYLTLDRSLNGLSGGEKMRIKLLSHLTTQLEGQILFFENLSFGVSELEIGKIVELFHGLMAQNNTIVLIDNHPYFRKLADFQINLATPST